MSEAQIEHAMTIEGLAPRLAALRIELCPIHMSEDSFWKIYFVLLHPRLSKHDTDLLSTPQIVEARAMLMQSLQSKSGAKVAHESVEDHVCIQNHFLECAQFVARKVKQKCSYCEHVYCLSDWDEKLFAERLRLNDKLLACQQSMIPCPNPFY